MKMKFEMEDVIDYGVVVKKSVSVRRLEECSNEVRGKIMFEIEKMMKEVDVE
jgi:hypothetical protein